jgi:hypothetical protein
MACERLEFPVLSFPSASHAVPPERELAEARELVEGWLATTFLHRADAVEDLVVQIAAALAARGEAAGR